MSSLLEDILAHKRREIEAARAALPAKLLEQRLLQAPQPRDFCGALRRATGMAVIAEVKRASPSAGSIRADADPVLVAESYARHGAACISVLTDEKYFRGTLDDLRRVRDAVFLPVLRKDFVLDRYQLLEARAAGADCVLLIAECLDDCRLRELYFAAGELNLDVLVEIHDTENLDRVLELQPPLLGINNRNLKTMATDLEHTLHLAGRIPPETLLVSESGIRSREDVVRLEAAGVRAILVGETLMRAADPGAMLGSLLGRAAAGNGPR